MSEQEQVAVTEQTVEQSESPAEQAVRELQAGATDTPETVAESDEEKNAREVAERQRRSEAQTRGVRQRFAELTGEKKALAAQNAQLTEILNRLSGQPPQRAQEVQGDVAPSRDDKLPNGQPKYASYEDFLDARADYRAGKIASERTHAALADMERRSAQGRQDAAAQHVRGQFEQRLSEHARSDPEFADVMANEDVRIPNEAAALLHLMPDAPQIMKAFHKNPDLAAQLWNTPVPALVLGQISASLRASPQVSNAPSPGRPVGSKPGSASEPPSDPNAYMAWAAKHMR